MVHLLLELSSGRLEIDLGAENLVAAQRDESQIAVEIKSFLAPSLTSEFHKCAGSVSELSSGFEAERTGASSLSSSSYQGLPKLFYGGVSAIKHC
ncbi:MAG: element excision factor XisH family protein [Nodosilinea sp.]